ncbi:hypothetical protein V1502_11270 [Bacillus sp. SCS-153A]|uniref:hypothetical protein n=1 Tax=Rossellomorea sedimentorum TaxID=3115294 RepID=UPI0039059B57
MLKMSETGLMAEHLVMHDGVMHRLLESKLHVQDEKLKKVVSKQIDVLKEHAETMMDFLGYDGSLSFSEMDKETENYASKVLRDRHVALDGLFTANSLSKTNYTHSTVMKDKEVKETHVRMAMDQMEIAKQYEEIIKENGWSVQPSADSEETSEIVDQIKEMIEKPKE